MALFVAVSLTLSLTVVLTLASAKRASALCGTTGFEGTWSSSDGRLSEIDVWPGAGCNLYARAWSTCENDPTSDCSWGTKKLSATPDPKFRFFYYNWSDADEVLQLTLKNDRTHLSVWDHTDYHSGQKSSIAVSMVKD
ncbi:hypothetical protein ABZ619_01240 [Streptomyces sp. NPDC007851]|uniref:hypothetical protein n=1 Tax=Streptomyces sp. NPDC007851 TaxID=3155008 RepID=UPI0033D0B32E